jgi:hypothetical protein
MKVFVHEKIIPSLVSEATEVDENATTGSVLKPYGLKNICDSTIKSRLAQLGFYYKLHRKSYYADGHDKEDTIKYRKQFLRRYLQVYEP